MSDSHLEDAVNASPGNSARLSQDLRDVAASPSPTPSPMDMMDRFCSHLARGLSKLLNVGMAIRSAGLCQRTSADFLALRQQHGCCWQMRIFSPPQADGDAARESVVCLELAPRAAYAFVGRILGGDLDSQYIPARPPTDIERRILGKVAEVAFGAAMASLGDQHQLSHGPCEDLTDCHITPDIASQQVWEMTFAIAIGKGEGKARLSVPVRGLIAQDAAARQLQSTQSGAPASRDRQAGAYIEISAHLEGMTITLDELAQLHGGDLVSSETAVDGEVIIRVAGIPKFAGRLGCSNGRRAVTITRQITPTQS